MVVGILDANLRPPRDYSSSLLWGIIRWLVIDMKPMPYMPQSCQAAFTLIELLVVIAIIALLISILLPSLQQSRAQAKMIVCQSTVRQFGTANQTYAVEQSGRFVYIKTAHGTNGAGYHAWVGNKLFQKLMVTDTNPQRDDDDRDNWSRPHGPVYTCPSKNRNARRPVAGAPRQRNNYGWNRYPIRWDEECMWRAHDVKHQSSKLMFADASDWHLVPEFADYARVGQWPTGWDISRDNELWNVSFRHFEGANILFFDNHIELRHKVDVWFPGDTTRRERLWRINTR